MNILSFFRSPFARMAGVAFVLLTLYAGAAGLRRYVFVQQTPLSGPPLPFTMESAVQYRYIRLLFTGEAIPKFDRQLEYPRGIKTFENDTVGSEYVYAALARLFPETVVLSDRVRWIEVLVFSTGIPLLALWIRRRTGSWGAGCASAALYAVSLGAVIRSTGHEISHENFALPIWIAHLAMAASLAETSASPARWQLLRPWISGLLLALALVCWDMIQLPVAAWLILRGIEFFKQPRGWSDPWWKKHGPTLLCLMVAGALNPYLRAHGFLFSPVMALGWGLIVGACVLPRGTVISRTLLAATVLAIAIIGGRYFACYGHFFDLLFAKIRHLNVKPADPALLNFNQRIMWAPALHSADWFLAHTWFTYLMWAAAGSALFLGFQAFRGRTAARRALPLLLATIGSWIGFWFFVRFSVFTSLLSAALVGTACAMAFEQPRRWVRAVAMTLLAATVILDLGHVLRGVRYWGPQQMYYPQMHELGKYLREHISPAPVLANFQTSGFIAGYSDCPVLLHPKFESPDIRKRVEEYGTLLFSGTERQLRDWADEAGARYVVYSMGEFSGKSVEYQMRYMVNTLRPPPQAPAHLFERAPERLRLFERVFSNPKYRVFRIVTHADEIEAARLADEARRELLAGHAPLAESLAAQALKHDARHGEARRLLAEAALRRAESGQPELHP